MLLSNIVNENKSLIHRKFTYTFVIGNQFNNCNLGNLILTKIIQVRNCRITNSFLFGNQSNNCKLFSFCK